MTKYKILKRLRDYINYSPYKKFCYNKSDLKKINELRIAGLIVNDVRFKIKGDDNSFNFLQFTDSWESFKKAEDYIILFPKATDFNDIITERGLDYLNKDWYQRNIKDKAIIQVCIDIAGVIAFVISVVLAYIKITTK